MTAGLERRPIRVLQVVDGLPRAGTETWLRNVHRLVDKSCFEMAFVVATPGAYDRDVEADGGTILTCGGARRPWLYAPRLARLLLAHGPFDVVHSHVHHYSGLVLAVSALAGVRARFVHSHLAPRASDARTGRRLYTAAMGRLIARYATRGFAVSDAAAPALFGDRWRDDARFEVLCCGVDVGPFRAPARRASARRALGVSEEAFAVGHVGRFEHQKNHALLLEVARATFERSPRAVLILAGGGALRDVIEERAKQLGIASRILFAGERANVAEILDALDVFVMPSLYEGLPLAALEAQAAGLSLVLSSTISRQVAVAEGRVKFLSLQASPGEWADALLSSAPPSAESRQRALAALSSSPFTVEASARALCRAYRDAVGGAAPGRGAGGGSLR